MNDLLGDALRGKRRKQETSSSNKGHPQPQQHVPSRLTVPVRIKNISTSHKTPITNKRKTVSSSLSCCFCKDSRPVISVQKSFTAKSYCLLHYYTTKACRIDVSKVHFHEYPDAGAEEELNTQLPFVQNMFSEAFSELQQDISAESTKAFKAMSERESDPLSILLEPTNTTRTSAVGKKRGNNSKKSKDTILDENQGGFLRQVQEKELSLMKEQSRRIESDALASLDSQDKSNLYKRRKTSAMSSWHLVMSNAGRSLANTNKNNDTRPWDNQNLASGMKCPTCSSKKIEVDANITSGMDDVSKAQTWGTKRDSDIATRLRCLECNHFWFDEEY